MCLAVSKELQDLTIVVNGFVEAIVIALHYFIYEAFNCISLFPQLQ